MGKFVIRRVNTGYKFTLRASNGQGIAASEVYNTRAACLRGIESVRKNAPIAGCEDHTAGEFSKAANPKFELYQDRGGAFRFRLKARNGSIIAVSDSYVTRAACENGIDSVRKNAKAGEITEETE